MKKVNPLVKAVKSLPECTRFAVQVQGTQILASITREAAASLLLNESPEWQVTLSGGVGVEDDGSITAVIGV